MDRNVRGQSPEGQGYLNLPALSTAGTAPFKYRIGMDLGGTKIEGIVLDRQGREIFRKRILTEQEKGAEHILDQIRYLYEELVSGIEGETHTLGIGTPGALSLKTGLLKNSNTVCLNGTPFKTNLEKKLGRKFEMQNDANCFALAEALQGAGCGKTLVFGVILGTGCGGGIVHEGKIWTGLQTLGGEWGHMTIDPQGPECYCGARGCVETLISGGGIEKLYAKRFHEAHVLPEILKRYRSGEKELADFMNIVFRNFGRALANVINILDPDVVVLGGGVSNMEELYTQGVEEVRRAVFSDSLETPILKNKLGDSAGVIGAAWIGASL